MSLPLALARIEQIERALVPQPAATSPAASVAGPSAPSATAASASVGSPSFASLLGNASGSPIATIAAGEVGQAEQPPGSNDSPRIAQYRTATAGSGVGPWCAYFVSWAARQAGTPLGDHGEGFGSVDALYAWAQRAGRAIPNGPGVVPRAGDLIVWDEHVGIVEQVLPDGRIQTLEGNSSDRVSRNLHDFSDALGFVRMS
jgi:hypothetical protein